MRIKKEDLKIQKAIEFACLKEAICNALENPGCVVDDVIQASPYEIKSVINKKERHYGEKEDKALLNIFIHMERAEKHKLRDLVKRIDNYASGLKDNEQLAFLSDEAYKLACYTADKGFQNISTEFLKLFTKYSALDNEKKSKKVEYILNSVVRGYAKRVLYTGRSYKAKARDTIQELIDGRFGEVNVDIDKLINAYNDASDTVHIDGNYQELHMQDKEKIKAGDLKKNKQKTQE